MNEHGKKYIAPVVITVFSVVMMCVFLAVCVFFRLPLVLKIIWGGICLLQIGASVFVLIERIKEIRSGEEDDLSKY